MTGADVQHIKQAKQELFSAESLLHLLPHVFSSNFSHGVAVSDDALSWLSCPKFCAGEDKSQAAGSKTGWSGQKPFVAIQNSLSQII